VLSGEDVEISFDGGDIASVAKMLLCDVVELNLAVDPLVQGTVTLASVGPIPRKDVLPTLECVLRMHMASS
jgi:general secretion pathway protein D